MTKLTTQVVKNNLKTHIVTKYNSIFEESKPQIMQNFKNSNSDKTQTATKLKTKLKLNLYCDKTQKLKL